MRKRARRRARKPPIAPPAMAPTGGLLAEGVEVDDDVEVDDVVVAGSVLLVELAVVLAVVLAGKVVIDLVVGSVVEAAVMNVLVVLLSTTTNAVDRMVVTSSFALLVACTCLPSMSAKTNIGPGVAAVLETSTWLVVLVAIVWAKLLVLLDMAMAVGALRFGPVSSKMAACRDLLPKIPVFRAKTVEVSSGAEVSVSIWVRAPSRPSARPLKSGTIMLLGGYAVHGGIRNEDRGQS